MSIQHDFTETILEILAGRFPDQSRAVFDGSELLQYLNIKTRSASSGSKARASFGNLYAIYVLVEDYLSHGFDQTGEYSSYEGARFSDLLRRQRELPFGSKLQNHALNHRLNQEFQRYFPASNYVPIMRDLETKRYWINENILNVSVLDSRQNIGRAVIDVIDAYIGVKRGAFESFIEDCRRIQAMQNSDATEVRRFIEELVRPNVDARIFEIVSYAILKPYYGSQFVWWGWSRDSIHQDSLVLYKTGRTNANDGGIDFVMKPLGRFFQVTETVDVNKYFLDIDKVQRYPITFIVKSEDSVGEIRSKIEEHARHAYGVTAVVRRYMQAVEELVNIPILLDRLNEVVEEDKLEQVIDELITQSKLEFNLSPE